MHKKLVSVLVDKAALDVNLAVTALKCIVSFCRVFFYIMLSSEAAVSSNNSQTDSCLSRPAPAPSLSYQSHSFSMGRWLPGLALTKEAQQCGGIVRVTALSSRVTANSQLEFIRVARLCLTPTMLSLSLSLHPGVALPPRCPLLRTH